MSWLFIVELGAIVLNLAAMGLNLWVGRLRIIELRKSRDLDRKAWNAYQLSSQVLTAGATLMAHTHRCPYCVTGTLCLVGTDLRFELGEVVRTAQSASR